MKTSKKFVLAAAGAVALLIGLATPAAAGGPYPIEVTAGTLDTVLGQFDLAPNTDPNEPQPPCAAEPPAGDVALTTDSAGSGTWDVSGGYKGRFQLPGAGATDPWYQADFSLTGAGSYSGSSSPYTLDGQIFAQVDIYEIVGPDCAKDDLQCEVNGLFTITSGSFVGTLPNASVGDTAVIDADTVSSGFPLTTANCGGPFAGLAFTDASLTGMTLTLV